jgi:hypothetical protein
MSNRRKRRATRSMKTPLERYMADRYRPVRQYTPGQVRQILVDDGCNRADTPLSWYVDACKYIAAKERKHIETVHCEIAGEVEARTGLPLPITGLTL